MTTMKKPRVTNEEVIAAYRDTGSVWRAGDRLGLSGQTVHNKLTSIGFKVGNRWTEADVERLRYLAPNMTINQLSESLGRSYAGIACKLNEIGASPKKVHEKKPRRRSDDEVRAETEAHIKAIESQTGHVTTYCRSVGIGIETFVRRAERFFPEWWKEYRESHSDLDRMECPGCGESFKPFTSKQKYCTRKCRVEHAADRDYFGGKRTTALGFNQGKCVLCHEKKASMNVHHTVGKENDPDNEGLVLLCSGCHHIVGTLGGRDYSEDDWANLVMLATVRRHGAKFAANEALRAEAEVYISFKELTEGELAEEAAEIEELGDNINTFYHE